MAVKQANSRSRMSASGTEMGVGSANGRGREFKVGEAFNEVLRER